MDDKKLLEKYKKIVRKQYPKAFLVMLSSGYYTIGEESDDLSFKDILLEYYLPVQKTPLLAWQLASISSKTTQNLNRTHPLRIEGQKMEDKIARVEERRIRTFIEKERKIKSNIYI